MITSVALGEWNGVWCMYYLVFSSTPFESSEQLRVFNDRVLLDCSYIKALCGWFHQQRIPPPLIYAVYIPF